MTALEPPLAPIVLVFGDAAPLVDAAVSAVVDAAMSRIGIPAFNHGRFRAGEGAMAALGAAATPPMMADLRLVEVRDLEEASPELMELLVEYTERPSPTTVLLLAGTGLPKANKGQPNWGVRLKNAVGKVGRVQECKAQGLDLPRFAAQTAHDLGKRLSPQDARALVEWIGADPSRVRSEVEKLALYVGHRDVITAEDVREGSALMAEAEIWDLTGAIAARNVDAALGATHRLLEAGEDARRLLAMIAWQLRDVAKATELVRAGAPDGEVKKHVRLRWDVLRAVRTGAESAPGAAATLAILARANRAMNEHKAGDAKVLEALVLDLCGA